MVTSGQAAAIADTVTAVNTDPAYHALLTKRIRACWRPCTLSAADRRDLLVQTALASGYPLDTKDPQSGFWQRINLYDAALETQHH